MPWTTPVLENKAHVQNSTAHLGQQNEQSVGQHSVG